MKTAPAIRNPPLSEDYRRSIASLHTELGIPADYATRAQLVLCEEAAELVSIGTDISGREQRLHPKAAEAWRGMRDAAQQHGIQLLVVSGYRSVDYQRALIQRKLDRGMKIAEVLRINAAPGYSEHHTGRALDLTAPDCPPLEQGFETTSAFAWLQKQAAKHHFRLSYPRNNPHGITYEPWHWAFHD